MAMAMAMAAGASTSASEAWKRRRDPLARTLESRRLPEGAAGAGEPVPGSVAPEVMPFIRAADAVEPRNPRVAFLCRKYAYKKIQSIDPSSIQRGVRQFKTYMSIKLDQDDTEVPVDDAFVIQKFYKEYCADMSRISEKRNFEEMARYYQVASALYEVLRHVTNNKVDPEVKRCAEMVDEEGRHFKNYKYNIVPLNFPGSSETILELPEISVAIDAISNIDGLPEPHMSPIRDLLDWLSLAFGFQKSNVENQREHMVLLLANISTRAAGLEGHPFVDTVDELWEKILGNYESWCSYLHVSSSIRLRHNDTEQKKQQLMLLHIGLYLLIWGEASNVRFMPECLCFIFHHMAKQLHEMVDGNYFQSPPGFEEEGSFLKNVIEPIFKVLQKEVQKSRGGTAGHSAWRNYDDLNELFWSEKCFKKLKKWPSDLTSDFFYQDSCTARKPKTNFVEVRTFLHIFRSFNRMWLFFILAFQAMLIVSWSSSGSLSGITDATVFRNVLSVFITAALLNFLQVTLDIMLTVKAWGSMEWTKIIRYLLKFVVAVAWIVILPLTYSSSLKNPSGAGKLINSWIGNWYNESVYNFAIVIYMVPDIFAALFFLLPCLQNAMERSNWHVVGLLMWWIQPRLYVGRGMHEDILSILKYVFFWALLLVSKLAFSFYVEISPLIVPTQFILDQRRGNYEWHQIFPFLPHNLGVIITIWAPIVLVYFMDTQIWYAIFSTVFGGVSGALSHVGEIRTLGMVRARFKSMPEEAFGKCSVATHIEQQREHEKNSFFGVWNSFIHSLREEDLISDREKHILMAPSSPSNISVTQWPTFLLASKVPVALHMAMNSKEGDDHELIEKIKLDRDRYNAVIECYESLKIILRSLLPDSNDWKIVSEIDEKVNTSMRNKTLLEDFQMEEIEKVSAMLANLLQLLVKYEPTNGTAKIVNGLQDFMEIVTRDFMKDRQSILKDESEIKQSFTNLNVSMIMDTSWREKFIRLHLLLTMKDSAMDVPINLDARRRITFFANSLFMKMPNAPRIQDMISFSVLTPYYNEEVLYSSHELNKKNEDGISILFYLQKIYPDEWNNFLERLGVGPDDEGTLKARMDDIRLWASFRGQTLARTVRGMMYYRQALILQCHDDMINDQADLGGEEAAWSNAIADTKFTYVVSCQLYGMHKASKDPREKNLYENILNLMLTYPALRVAYVDEKEIHLPNGKIEKQYYSVLVKGDNEEIYRIRLPGKPTEVGEGKPNNQNHAIIFTRGEALQAIDMNQDNYLEEAFKMRNLLQEFHRKSKPTILGVREHIFTGSVSSLAWFMSNQETSFVTIGQRVLANPLKVRFHYGHPDVFDRVFHLTRGGISKASKVINLSEDIFAGFNSTLRGGNVTHHEYIQLGKGRDVGMNQISNFEAKVANGNGEQTLCRDIYRLGHRFDFYRMLSLYFTTVGFYFNSMVAVLTVYVFLYGRLYLVLSGLEKSILQDPDIQNIKPFENALATQSVFQLGMLLVLPMMIEVGLEKGFGRALAEFVIMQLQLAPVFFTFHLGTKTHYYGRTILHGGAKYRPTGRGFVVRHAKFAENYRMYSRSHFVKALELLILLVVYLAYGSSYRSSSLYLYVTISIWLLVFCWLFAPFVFNPSCFEWHKTVDDWIDWWKWMGNRGGIGLAPEKSWEAWWVSEHDHLKNATIRSLLLEFILSLRLLIYQYGIVYHLHIVHGNKSFMVYALSWLVIAIALVSLKIVSLGREKFVTRLQLVFRIIKGIVFLVLIGLLVLLFVAFDLTISDVGASILAFIPTGWFILLIAQLCGPMFRRLILEPIRTLCCPCATGDACRGPCCAKFRQRTGAALRKMGPWDSIQEMARMYEYTMGILIFLPIAVLSWFPFVSEFQTRLLFNQAFSRGLQISRILAGQNGSGSKRD